MPGLCKWSSIGEPFFIKVKEQTIVDHYGLQNKQHRDRILKDHGCELKKWIGNQAKNEEEFDEDDRLEHPAEVRNEYQGWHFARVDKEYDKVVEKNREGNPVYHDHGKAAMHEWTHRTIERVVDKEEHFLGEEFGEIGDDADKENAHDVG